MPLISDLLFEARAAAQSLATLAAGPHIRLGVTGLSRAGKTVFITALIEHHKREGNAVTIALQRVTNPLEFGVVVTDEAGRITRFLEKPSWGEVFSDTINTGIYVLEPAILERMTRGRNYDFSKDLFPEMLRDGAKLGGYIIDAYWTDIGNLEQYQQANYDALEGKVRLDSLGTEIAPGILAGEGCSCTARSSWATACGSRRASRSSDPQRSATAASSNTAPVSRAPCCGKTAISVKTPSSTIARSPTATRSNVTPRSANRPSSAAAARSAPAPWSTRTSSCGPTSG